MTTITFKEFVPIAEEPIQAAPESETAWIARLKRQRQIIKAHFEKRHAATEAGPFPVRERQGLAKAA
jgi:hypothetical protein